MRTGLEPLLEKIAMALPVRGMRGIAKSPLPRATLGANPSIAQPMASPYKGVPDPIAGSMAPPQPKGPGLASRMKWPLAAAGLGTAAALAVPMWSQYEEDQRRMPHSYMAMPGSSY